MSSTRPTTDTCEAKQSLAESMGPGAYRLNEPKVCDVCYPVDPHYRLQKVGDSLVANHNLIDIDSELNGLTRKYSRCPQTKWTPQCGGDNQGGYPCGQGVIDATCYGADGKPPADGQRCPDGYAKGMVHMRDCATRVDETRTTNPPCNLRGTGINRWEWLCQDPQASVNAFSERARWGVSNRIVVKDNHRPCLPQPVDQSPALPKYGDLGCMETTSTCITYALPTQPPPTPVPI